MASVQDLKDALATEQQRAVQLAEQAFQAIDTVTNAANFWLTGLSIGLATLAIVGYGVLYGGARNHAKKVAESRIDSYLRGDEGRAFVRQAIADEVRSQIEAKAFVVVQPAPAPVQNGVEEAFPADPNAAEKVGGAG